MARFKLTIEYEGTRYSGWQIQKNARTVQGEIASAVGKALGTKEFELYGAGRTDSGVHALRQVAHLEAASMLAPEILRRKLNDDLPSDINILEISKAPPRFHARHHAVSRSYLYQISRRRTAFGKRFVWWIKEDLDIEAMKAAARLFVGLKDFRSFTADDPDEKSTKVEIEGIQVKKQDGSQANVKLQPSNLQIITLNLDDKKRIAKLKNEKKEEVKEEKAEKVKKAKKE